MEHCFRVAVCLICFLAYLQARPINLGDLGLDFITGDVSCAGNVTFISPSNVQTHCCTAAFKAIMEQLKQARANCTDANGQISETLNSLELYSCQCPQSEQKNSSDCKWETEEDQKTLKEFVADIESFMQLLITIQSVY